MRGIARHAGAIGEGAHVDSTHKGRGGTSSDKGGRSGRRGDDRGGRGERGGYRDDRRSYRDGNSDRGGERRGDDARDGRGNRNGYRGGHRGYREEAQGYQGGYRDDGSNRGGYRERDERRGDRHDDRRGYRDNQRGYRGRDGRDDRWHGQGDGRRGYQEGGRGTREDDGRSYRDDYREWDDRRYRGRDDRPSYRDSRRGDRDERSGYRDSYRRGDRDYRERGDRREPDGPDALLDRSRGDSAGEDARRDWAPRHCPVARRCGGCEWLSMPYDVQLRMKQEAVEDLFAPLRVKVDPIVGMDDPAHYRNKVQLPFAPGHPLENGRMTARWGIFERGTHHIVCTRECLVEDKRARPIIAFVADMLPRLNIEPYDERTGRGLLRYVLVRTSLHTGQVMVVLVVNGNRLPSEQVLVDSLLERFPAIRTVVLNTNQEHTSVILGKRERVLYGPGHIEDSICGCTFRISPSSFYQTNPSQAERLYQIAIEMAGLRPEDHFGDAYCGTGTIGIAAAKASGAHLMGVERNPDAVEDARANARMNGLGPDQAEFVVGDAGSVFARMARAGKDLDVVFMDPPRSGANQAFLANLSRLSPRRVVYISCNPRTQMHDIHQMRRNGYQVRRIVPVDMFPHTDHVETVVLLERPLRNRRVTERRDQERFDRRHLDVPQDASLAEDSHEEYTPELDLAAGARDEWAPEPDLRETTTQEVPAPEPDDDDAAPDGTPGAAPVDDILLGASGAADGMPDPGLLAETDTDGTTFGSGGWDDEPGMDVDDALLAAQIAGIATDGYAPQPLGADAEATFSDAGSTDADDAFDEDELIAELEQMPLPTDDEGGPSAGSADDARDGR